MVRWIPCPPHTGVRKGQCLDSGRRTPFLIICREGCMAGKASFCPNFPTPAALIHFHPPGSALPFAWTLWPPCGPPTLLPSASPDITGGNQVREGAAEGEHQMKQTSGSHWAINDLSSFLKKIFCSIELVIYCTHPGNGLQSLIKSITTSEEVCQRLLISCVHEHKVVA